MIMGVNAEQVGIKHLTGKPELVVFQPVNRLNKA
jgi:hypothetical protein